MKRDFGFDWALVVVWVLFFALTGVALLVLQNVIVEKWFSGARSIAAAWAVRGFLSVATGLPFLLTYAIVSKLTTQRDRISGELGIPAVHVDRESVAAAKMLWSYEHAHFESSMERVQLYGRLFGLISSMLLAACVTLIAAGDAFAGAGILTFSKPRLGVLSVGVAVVTVFAMQFARCVHRVSRLDYTAGMFAWAIRSVLFVVIADIGLFVLVRKASAGIDYPGAILLGVFTGSMGDRALRLMQEKVAAALKLGGMTRIDDMSLRTIDGMTEEDLERLAEEGIVCLTDLAFVPTARLFFNTGYSLQRIVDWQNQALLGVHVGALRAKALAAQLGVRGATDLWEIADGLGVGDPEWLRASSEATTPDERVEDPPNAAMTSRSPGEKSEDDALKALRLAMGLENGALRIALRTVHSDVATRRLRVHAQSAPSQDG